MKKRVLHIISSVNWRGGEQQVDAIFNYSHADFDYYIFCPENAELQKRNEAKKSNIFTYKKRFGADILAAFKLKKVCAVNQIDLIHLHDSHAINTYYIACLFGLKIPAVIHRHVNFPVTKRWKYNAEKIKKIICVSETVKAGFQSFITEEKLVVIQPGIEISQWSENNNSQKIKNELNLSNEHKIIGIVAALEKEKNIEEFLEIAKKVIEQNDNFHFVLIGDGSLMHTYTQSTKQQKKNIHFLGFREDVKELICGFDVFLFTSKNEGFPLVLLEAMATKIPILSNNFPSVNELLQHQKNGLIYKNVEDAVYKLQLLNTETAQRKQLVENAFQFVQQFDITLMNQRIADVYKSIFTHA
jgi:glycosyltransferase involved in cell wall biosynthesis